MPILRQRITAAIVAVGESVGLQAALLFLVLVASALLPIRGLGIETCWWHYLFGVNCPGCGLTRSFISLAHGRVADAFGYNWMGPPLFLGTVLAWADRLFRLCAHRPLFPFFERGEPFRLVFYSLLISWVARLVICGCTA